MLKNIEQIEVVRSYSKKVQLKQFEPIDLFSSYKAILKSGVSEEEIKKISQWLFDKAKDDVDTDLLNKQF